MRRRRNDTANASSKGRALPNGGGDDLREERGGSWTNDPLLGGVYVDPAFDEENAAADGAEYGHPGYGRLAYRPGDAALREGRQKGGQSGGGQSAQETEYDQSYGKPGHGQNSGSDYGNRSYAAEGYGNAPGYGEGGPGYGDPAYGGYIDPGSGDPAYGGYNGSGYGNASYGEGGPGYGNASYGEGGSGYGDASYGEGGSGYGDPAYGGYNNPGSGDPAYGGYNGSGYGDGSYGEGGPGYGSPSYANRAYEAPGYGEPGGIRGADGPVYGGENAPEEDYEDYDEETRADIGEDIRSILSLKEERDALAERIRPMDFEELPPVGDGEGPAKPFEDLGGYQGYEGGQKTPDDAYNAGQAVYPEEPLPEEEPKKPGKKKKVKTARPYLFVSYAFVAIFLLLIGHLVYFNVMERDKILASPYNRRQDDLAAKVVRGSILAQDGSEIASTQRDDLGNETRIYPYGSIFAHVVGYSSNGRSGLEAAENASLLTSHMDIIDRAERELRGEKALGDHVVTTLSAKLQQAAWYALGGRQGAVVVLDPKTGAVLAMVSKPDFDPNTISESWSAIVSDPNNSCLLNRATQGLYVPGSTFKILTALAYYREHGSLEGYSFDCTGEIAEGENVIHCAGGSVHGLLDFTSAFAVSCNCAFSDMGRSLGAKALTDVMDSLLLGKTLPCPVLASKSRYDLSASDSTFRLMQTAFGQGGTIVTPWQMALIVSAIANGGTLMEPYLVDKTISADGKVVETHSPRTYRRLMSEEEAGVLGNLLRSVVTNGSAVELASFPVACYGKTGSAEFTRSDGSRGTHAWFVGYAGAKTPDLAFAILAEDSGSGAETAVPMAHIMLNAFYS